MRSMKKTEVSLAHSHVPSPPIFPPTHTHIVLAPVKVPANSCSEESALSLRVDSTLAFAVLGKLAILPLSS